jgi:ribosomal protein S18 acetylase RimI-like enzyme
MRPANTGDQPFLEILYRFARPDLQFIDGEPELVNEVIAQQYEILQQGAGNQYPNAMHFLVEKTQERIGALIVDFGTNEVRVIYVAFIPTARGFGYGKAILQGVQQAAANLGCPVSVVVWRNNPGAKLIYLQLGFQVEESQPLAERMTWYPGTTVPN